MKVIWVSCRRLITVYLLKQVVDGNHPEIGGKTCSTFAVQGGWSR
jgi:hypothetical protein